MFFEDSYKDVVASVKQQIDYDDLIQSDKMCADEIDCVVDLITEVYMSKQPVMVIARESRPMDLVLDRFSRLTSEHIKYVFECLNSTRTEVKNIRQYLRAALFNAPATMEPYYGRKVLEHQMGIGCRKSESE